MNAIDEDTHFTCFKKFDSAVSVRFENLIYTWMRKISEMPFSDPGHVFSRKKRIYMKTLLIEWVFWAHFRSVCDLYLDILTKFGDDRDRSQSREASHERNEICAWQQPNNFNFSLFRPFIGMLARTNNFPAQVYHQEHNQ